MTETVGLYIAEGLAIAGWGLIIIGSVIFWRGLRRK